MRTTVDIDHDILSLAKHLASERDQSIGRILSELARRGLRPDNEIVSQPGLIPVLPRKPGGGPVTMQAVKELLESES